jgi:hypothetical protein
MTDTAAMIKQPEDQTPAELWSMEISAAEKELKTFHKRGRQVTRKFLDERDSLNVGQRWFNVFYANTNILESALYAQLPKPSVSRKYIDYQDDVARVAAMIIERSISQDLDDPTDTLDATIRHCVQDRLVPGMAQAWLRLETETQELSVPPTPGTDEEDMDDAPKPEVLPEDIVSQKVVVDYIFWQDFLFSPCRIWEERRWVGRRAYMSYDQLVERFGEKKAKTCPLNFTSSDRDGTQGSTPKEDVLQKAIVYEIWDRTTRTVIWYCKGMQELLDQKEDFLKLTGFEPCPKPMLANISTSNAVPRPDYFMIQDQYMELDTVNNRISLLVHACKVSGVYDKAQKGVESLFTASNENRLVPVDNWGAFAEKGGLKGTIDWVPLDTIVQALERLNVAREAIKGQIYELTGIADIVRGASKASETLGAQQIKAQFASVRIKKLQDEVARFASDIMRIKAEIMVKHFDPQILIAKSNIMATGNDEWVGPAMELLTTEAGFEWRIQVTADTLAQADYTMEKTDRVEFMTAASKYMQQFMPMIAQAPDMAPILLGLLKWAVAGFRGARDIEGMLDKSLDQLERKARQPKPPAPPSPEQIKMQAEQQKMQMEMQQSQQEHQLDMQTKVQDAQMEQQGNMLKLQFEQQRADMEMRAEEQRIALEEQRMQMEMMFERMMTMLKLKTETELAQIKLESANDLAVVKEAQAKANTPAST